MNLSLFSGYFKTEKRQHALRVATFIMFIMLAVEKVLSSIDAEILNGRLHIVSAITVTDIICVCIYITTAVLIAARVRYDRLVIPDFILLAVKLQVIVTKSVFLITEREADFVEKFSAAEYIIEAALFSTFLICMFIGELSHGRRLQNFPSVCMNLLVICLPVTVLLELGKVFLETAEGMNRLLIGIDFVLGVLNETFLDIPYFMLILMVCLTENRKHE